MSDSGDFFHELGAGQSEGDFCESCQFCHDVDEIVCGIFGQECVEHVFVEGHIPTVCNSAGIQTCRPSCPLMEQWAVLTAMGR